MRLAHRGEDWFRAQLHVIRAMSANTSHAAPFRIARATKAFSRIPLPPAGPASALALAILFSKFTEGAFFCVWNSVE